MSTYTTSDEMDAALIEGASIVLNTLYNLGYEIPDDYYSQFLEDVRKKLNNEVPLILRKPLKTLEPRK